MNYIASNSAPILVASLAGLLIGALYGTAIHRGRVGPINPAMLVAACMAEFWLACILAGALILAPNGAGRWTMAIGSAVVIWIGFVLPTMLVSYAFRRLGFGAIVADALHWLIVMVVQAAVLEAIGLVHP
ncbi:DUF1761 domain-containing protein [Lichenihabitans sp. Uapishka_5]|uniref:DUF1761 domain-containing protein n=1 Tax=Lichenihabitans sp. Uapishka_5 TaxID=3037302 RepID=UPI0029E7D645|nr:DUF1761 domain-containing protein [Lichenihabitans sp. Uapishka_5]MDX7949718.1 DUF1761 domain-containing protein [Lichenihabitans sp. Uapishka_5]